jgi:hypothetical protein
MPPLWDRGSVWLIPTILLVNVEGCEKARQARDPFCRGAGSTGRGLWNCSQSWSRSLELLWQKGCGAIHSLKTIEYPPRSSMAGVEL